jgi:hypothetical protein
MISVFVSGFVIAKIPAINIIEKGDFLPHPVCSAQRLHLSDVGVDILPHSVCSVQRLHLWDVGVDILPHPVCHSAATPLPGERGRSNYLDFLFYGEKNFALRHIYHLANA